MVDFKDKMDSPHNKIKWKKDTPYKKWDNFCIMKTASI